ncbi:hypothetical protein [Vibrio methylphosphonaticus]|uniref:hypothetical protein n=1 Tax=Vibrio methylphosphonaticus TaxID=2946866 RepID=UPI002029BF94|nr:hypothetical protein [Vibrio methylphosphonaticus]MCL9777052.1 hypothetical protein [Vibrio methylphosphonaticus]
MSNLPPLPTGSSRNKIEFLYSLLGMDKGLDLTAEFRVHPKIGGELDSPLLIGMNQSGRSGENTHNYDFYTCPESNVFSLRRAAIALLDSEGYPREIDEGDGTFWYPKGTVVTFRMNVFFDMRLRTSGQTKADVLSAINERGLALALDVNSKHTINHFVQLNASIADNGDIRASGFVPLTIHMNAYEASFYKDSNRDVESNRFDEFQMKLSGFVLSNGTTLLTNETDVAWFEMSTSITKVWSGRAQQIEE